MSKIFSTAISQRIARHAREQRRLRGWSMGGLSLQLHDHRCDIHPDGYQMSAQVINTIENGVAPQHGHPARIRPVSADELYVLAEVLRMTAREMMS